jgi:hypothetical protein
MGGIERNMVGATLSQYLLGAQKRYGDRATVKVVRVQ